MKEQNWEPCPRCGSNRVQSMGGCFFAVLGFCLIGISIWLLIIPPIGIVGILAGIFLMFVAPFMVKMLQCKDCKKSWRANKKDKSS
jgi:hypothetical protein